MYALFSLGHTDVWPVDDLAVVVGLQRLKKLKERPDKKQMEKLGEPWRPYRGCMAIFLWHYYGAATLDEAATIAVKGDKKAPAKKSKPVIKAKSLPKKKAVKKKSLVKTKTATKKTTGKKRVIKKKPVKRTATKKKITKPQAKAAASKKSRTGKPATGKTTKGKTPSKKPAIARRSYSLVADPRLKGRRTQGRRMPAGGRRGPR